jgi:MFS family permease
MSNSPTLNRYFGGFARALSSRRYRIYWTGQLGHMQGIWFYRIAAGWLMFELTHSPAWLGAIGFAMAIPILLISPIAGAVGDRIGHLRMAIISLTAGLPVMAAITALSWAGLMTPILLLVLFLVLTTFVAFEYPGRQALVPSLVPPEHLTEAMALNWSAFNTAAFTGPLLAGLLLSLGGATLSFAAVVVTYTIMLQALLRLRTQDDAPARSLNFSDLAADFCAGLRYTGAHRIIPLVLAVHVIAQILLRPYVDLMPGIAETVFAEGLSALATLLAASGIGAVIVAVVMTFLAGRFNLFRVLIFCAIAAAVVVVLFAATTNLWIAAVLVAALGGMLTGIGIASSTLIQRSVDEAYRGRVVSIMLALYIGGPSLGTLAVGWVSEFIGFQPALAAAAVLSVVITLALTRRTLRRGTETSGAG